MSSGRLILIGGVVFFALAVCIVLAAGLYWYFNTPARQASANVSLLTVTLSAPLNGDLVPLDVPSTVRAEAVSDQPIARLELWVDGVPSEVKFAPAGATLPGFSAFWTWTPAGAGEYTLVVRATDVKQHVATSNAVRVTAGASANAALQISYQVGPTDTVQTVAELFTASPQEIVDLNPQLDPGGALSPGQAISVPLPIPPPPPPGPGAPPDPGQPPEQNGVTPAVQSGVTLLPPPPNLPAAPQLSAKVEGCNVSLTINDQANNEDGFHVYRLDLKTSSFAQIAVLGPNKAAGAVPFADSGLFGHVEYYVSAYNGAGAAPSNIVSVDVSNPACLTAQWQEAQVSKAQVTVKKSVDKLYGYLAVNDGPWQRIAPTPNTFMYPDVNGNFDLSPYLTDLAPVQGQVTLTLELHLWGWAGNQLLYLGAAKQTYNLTPGPQLITLAGSDFTLTGTLGFVPPWPGTPPSPDPKVPPPWNVQLLTSPADAGLAVAHLFAGNVLLGPAVTAQLQDILKAHYAILVWDWLPNAQTKDVDGFHVWSNAPPNGLFNSIATVSQGKSVTGVILPAPTAKTCFAVSAYVGQSESAPSNAFCTPSAPVKWFQPVKTAIRVQVSSQSNCDAQACKALGYGEIPLEPYQLIAGFEWSYEGVPPPCNDCAESCTCADVKAVYQSALRFDLQSIANAPISEARLDFIPDSAAKTYGNESDTYCAGWLSLAGVDWDVNSPLSYFENPLLYAFITKDDFIDQAPDTVELDVTDAVKKWTTGASPNYGFIFAGSYWDGFANPPVPGTTDYCWSKLSQFVLGVTLAQ